jgi:hypothetical protein
MKVSHGREQREYEAYVDALELIGLLQAKARALLAHLPHV